MVLCRKAGDIPTVEIPKTFKIIDLPYLTLPLAFYHFLNHYE